MGRFGSFKPTRPLLTARATALTASSWPITLLCRTLSSFFSRSVSLSASFCTGTFVHAETTSAMSSSVTSGRAAAVFFRKRFFTLSSFSSACSCSFWSREASEKSPLRMLSSFCAASSLTVCSRAVRFSGTLYPLRLTFEHASSSTSMALSGRFRSVIYRCDNRTASSNALSLTMTLW